MAGIVGLLMFLGFGALFVDSWRDFRAYPATPTRMTVAEAMAVETPAPGAWVELTNVRLPCADAEQRPSSAVGYRLGFGETSDERVIVGDTPPCSDAPTSVIGVLRVDEPGRIVDLEFPGYPWASWPRRWQTSVWTASGPDDTVLGLGLMPPFALMGLVVLAFYWRPDAPPAPSASVIDDEPISPWDSSRRVLPARELRLQGTALYDRALSLFAVVVIAWVLFALAWVSVRLSGGLFGWLGAALFGGLGLLMVVALVRMAPQAKRDPLLLGPARHEKLIRVLEQRAATGNLVLKLEHPVTGEPIEQTFAMNAESPLVAGGCVLAVWGDAKAPFVVLREGGAPFELTRAEQVAAARALRDWAASLSRA